MVEPMRWWHIPAVHAIESECFTVDPWSVEQFWEELAQPTRIYRVAMRGDEVIGYAGIFHAGADADIQTIAVRPGEQRQGIGRMLVRELIAAAHQSGATALLLEVRADNSPAIAMYRDEGFDQISLRSRYYPDGSDALILRRSL
ncbi:MAG: ribosomal protein S18-alanine N-acetyltransferase [Actinomycetota bacterium]